jgi:hypothetical protein
MNLALDRSLSVYARTARLPLIGVTMPKLIYAAIASLDGYLDDEAGNSTGPRLTARCTLLSTISSGRWAPTFTVAGCTRRWSSGRP